jgi:hypothetical protein
VSPRRPRCRASRSRAIKAQSPCPGKRSNKPALFSLVTIERLPEWESLFVLSVGNSLNAEDAEDAENAERNEIAGTGVVGKEPSGYCRQHSFSRSLSAVSASSALNPGAAQGALAMVSDRSIGVK